MTPTNQGTGSTGRLVGFPREGAADARAMLRRIEEREPGAAADAVRLAAELENRPRLSGATRSLSDDAYEETYRFTLLADEMRSAVACLESEDPADLLAKARLLSLWVQEGEPAYAAELARTLRAGLATLASRLEGGAPGHG